MSCLTGGLQRRSKILQLGRLGERRRDPIPRITQVRFHGSRRVSLGPVSFTIQKSVFLKKLSLIQVQRCSLKALLLLRCTAQQ